VPIDFNFNTNMYWIEATMYPLTLTGILDLVTIQMGSSRNGFALQVNQS